MNAVFFFILIPLFFGWQKAARLRLNYFSVFLFLALFFAACTNNREQKPRVN